MGLLPGDKAEDNKAEDKNDELCTIDDALQTEDLPEEGGSPQACAFVVGDEAGAQEEDQEISDEREAIVEGGNGSRKASSDSVSNHEEAESQGNHWIHEMDTESKERNDDEGQGRGSEEVEVTGTKEHNNSSELSTTEGKATPQFKQENGEIKLKDLEGEANTQDPQISFHGATASMRISHSNVELGSMASSGTLSNGERSPERRRISRFLNRSTGNRTPKLNIFATAQARGRTLLPELRSKLSSFSQQVRSRSPRLNTKRPSLHGETNSQQKQRRRTCRTKIIEL